MSLLILFVQPNGSSLCSGNHFRADGTYALMKSLSHPNCKLTYLDMGGEFDDGWMDDVWPLTTDKIVCCSENMIPFDAKLALSESLFLPNCNLTYINMS